MARKSLIIFVSLCALTAAMVARNKRSLPDDETVVPPSTTSRLTSREPSKEICDRDTPCSWSVYTRFTRVPDYNISNHCVCRPGTTCNYFDDDISISAYVYRCLPLR